MSFKYETKLGVRFSNPIFTASGCAGSGKELSQFFNLKDPVIGGYSKEKIALRRAIILGYDVDEEIRVIRKNQAVKAEQMVAPVIPGHDRQRVAGPRQGRHGDRPALLGAGGRPRSAKENLATDRGGA